VSLLPDNVGRLFDVPLALIPDRVAVIQGDRELTFAQLDARCNRMANALRELGVGPGDRVALMFSNDFRFLESLFGPMRLGAVAVPLNTRMGDDALQYVVDDAEAVVMIANRAMAERARGLAARVPRLKHLIVEGPAADGALEYEPLLAAVSPALERRPTGAGEICMQPYTSGSTGRPKGVLLAHGGQIWNADALRKAALVDDNACLSRDDLTGARHVQDDPGRDGDTGPC
jgi:acyl-coenzyme A synthetase/AMP-(fatty) acid ligase